MYRSKTIFIITIFLTLFVTLNTKTYAQQSTGSTSSAKASTQIVQKYEAEELFPIMVKGKLGFIDSTGKEVIKPEHYIDLYHSFSEGMVAVRFRNSQKYGYMDRSGKIVIKPEFEYASEFYDGIAKVEINDKESGYIDKTGKIVIPLKRLQSPEYGFYEGLAKRYNEERKAWDYMDKTGKIALQTEFIHVGNFYEGLAQFQVVSNSNPSSKQSIKIKYGFIDKEGKIVIKPEYDYVSDFKEGIAIVGVNAKYGCIDRNGNLITQLEFDLMEGFEQGFAAVRAGKKYTFIDKTGKKIVSPIFDFVFNFSEGLAAVKVGNKWGFIDQHAKFVIQPKYFTVSPFSDGLASFAVGFDFLDSSYSSWGAIDKTGKVVIKAKYSDPLYFKKGIALAKKNNTEGYIDKKEHYVWGPISDSDKY